MVVKRSQVLAMAIVGIFVTVVSAADAPPQNRSEVPQPRKIVIYAKLSEDEQKEAIQGLRDAAEKILKERQLQATIVESDHFLIITDWDPAEHNFLTKNLETAYRLVASQFNMKASENVFWGRLPVFMFKDHKTFKDFAKKWDGVDMPADVVGYYRCPIDSPIGMGRLVMFKPDEARSDLVLAKKNWAYTLAHELTHAFMGRYKTNRRLPVWLSEGIAEVVATNMVPDLPAILAQRGLETATGKPTDIMAEGEKKATDYPVMKSLVQTLINRDHAAFIKMANAIKDGTDPETAVKDAYGITYADIRKRFLKQ